MDNARLSEMSQRMDEQSTGRNSVSKWKDRLQPMNGDIIDTMALAGGQRKSRTQKFQFNLRGGHTQRSQPDQGETANMGPAERSMPGHDQVELLQLGIVGKSAFSYAKNTGRESQPERPNNGKAAAGSFSKCKDTDKIASTSRSALPFAPHLDSSDPQKSRSLNSPTSCVSQRNKPGPEQVLLQIQEAPTAFRLPLSTSARGAKASSSSPTNRDAR